MQRVRPSLLASSCAGRLLHARLQRSAPRSHIWPSRLLRSHVAGADADGFGLTLSSATHVVGAHAFDAWTRSPRRFCVNESEQAEIRLTVVSRLCREQPDQVRLARLVADSAANCRFRTVPSMLWQAALYQTRLRDSGLLKACPHARVSHGDINQVAADYGLWDITGVCICARGAEPPGPSARTQSSVCESLSHLGNTHS